MSAQISILVVDNDPISLANCAQFLRKLGYQVSEATNPEEAQDIIAQSHLHLAVLDLRLRNDDDDRDRSGLHLAKEAPRVLPKLIWTKFPAYQDVVEVLRPDSDGLPPAVDFVDKRQGLPELQGAIEQVLHKHVAINWDLRIYWQFPYSFSQLALAIEPTLADGLLAARSSELEDLFRQLFGDSRQVTVDRMLYEQDGLIFLSVFAHDAAGFENHFVLAVGGETAVLHEATQYETTVPRQVGKETIEKQTTLAGIHYAATTYALFGQTWGVVDSLHNLYHQLSSSTHSHILRNIFQRNLAQWQQNSWDAGHVQAAYSDWANLPPDQEALYEKVQTVAQAIAPHGPILTFSSADILLNERNGTAEQAFDIPSDFWASYQQLLPLDPTAIKWGMTHGQLTLKTILANQSGGHGWLIQFSDANQRPLLCDFVALETAVTFDTFPCHTWQERFDFQQRLLQISSLEEMPNTNGLTDVLCKRLHFIVHLRRLASELTGATLNNYLYALFVAALGYVWQYDAKRLYPRHQLLKQAQALFTAITIADRQLSLRREQTEQQFGIDVDEADFTAYVDKTAVSLTKQEFTIFNHLYKRAGHLCTREAILAQIKGDDPDIEENRLNSAMSRLRQKIDKETKRPDSYITTVRGRGYRLDL